MPSDQFVIACLEHGSPADHIVDAARQMAARLNGKSLMLLCVCQPAQKDDATLRLKAFGLPYLVLCGGWREVLAALPTRFGGILAVTALDAQAPRSSIAHPATLLKTFAECKVAYLCLSPHRPFPPTEGLEAVVSLDYRRESKEKLIWASYLARFARCRLTVALPAYTDEALRLKLGNNLRFMKKMFDGLRMDYATRSVPYRLSRTADASAYDALGPGLMLAMTTDTRDRDLVDHLLGSPELRLLRRAAADSTPILLLNQRDDLYVLCD